MRLRLLSPYENTKTFEHHAAGAVLDYLPDVTARGLIGQGKAVDLDAPTPPEPPAAPAEPAPAAGPMLPQQVRDALARSRDEHHAEQRRLAFDYSALVRRHGDPQPGDPERLIDVMEAMGFDLNRLDQDCSAWRQFVGAEHNRAAAAARLARLAWERTSIPNDLPSREFIARHNALDIAIGNARRALRSYETRVAELRSKHSGLFCGV